MVHAAAGHRPAPENAPPDRRRWLTLVLLCLAQFMLIVDITVVQVALPTVGADLRLDRDALTWVVTAYTLCFGGLMVFGGRFSDVVGPRRTLLAGLAIFVAASLACGLAADGALLIAGRAVQGIGAALMSPAALSIVTTTFAGTERNRALGAWAAIGGAGAAVGVLLGGVLTAGPGWAWVFFVNVPVGLLVLAALPALVRGDGRRGCQRIDFAGALVVTAATASLVYGLINAGGAGWTAWTTLVPLAGAVILYALFGWIESRVAVPLVRLDTLARRPVVSGTFVMLLATALMIALFFLSSLYLQHTLRFDALQTGLLFLPVAVAITAGAQLASHLISRVGGRAVAFAGFALTALGAALLTQIPAQGNAYATVLPGFVIAAFGIGPVFVAATTTTLANVPHGEAGLASGVVSTFHELGGAIGVALASTVAAASISSGGTDIGGFGTGFLAAAVAAAAAGLIALVLVPGGRPASAGFGHGH